MGYEVIKELTKEQLVDLCTIYAKNWLATDGLWFQRIEAHYGFEQALTIDIEMWEKLTVIEANRIKDFLQLPVNPGLEGLKKALGLRLYAPLNQDQMFYENGKLIYKVITCRVQAARARKGMEYHTCKPVGLIEYSMFASTIDNRITTKCISCHPDITEPSCNCMWEFSIAQ